MHPRPKLKSILKKTSKYDTHVATPEEASKRDKHPHATKLASMLKPTEEEDDETEVDTAQHTPKVINQSTPGVSSSTQCFTEPPVTPPESPMEDHPELFNYHDQVVTRSAMELLEMEDEIAARGGLFERDGIVMTASALSLLQAQEAMARADTAGQGEWGRECSVTGSMAYLTDNASNHSLEQPTSGMAFGRSSCHNALIDILTR